MEQMFDYPELFTSCDQDSFDLKWNRFMPS